MIAIRAIGVLLLLCCSGAAGAQAKGLYESLRDFEGKPAPGFALAHEAEMRRELEDGARLCLPVSPIDCFEFLREIRERFPKWLEDNVAIRGRYRALQRAGLDSAWAPRPGRKPGPSRLAMAHALNLMAIPSREAKYSDWRALGADIRFLRDAVVRAESRADKELLASLLERDYALLDSLIDAAGREFGDTERGALGDALAGVPSLTAALLPRLDDLAAYVALIDLKASSKAAGLNFYEGGMEWVERPGDGCLDIVMSAGPQASWNASMWSYTFDVRSTAWLDMAASWRDQPPRARVQMPEHYVMDQSGFRGIRAHCTRSGCTLRSADGRAVAANKGLKLEDVFGARKGSSSDSMGFARVDAVRPPDYVELGLIVQGRDGNWIGPQLRLRAMRPAGRTDTAQVRGVCAD